MQKLIQRKISPKNRLVGRGKRDLGSSGKGSGQIPSETATRRLQIKLNC